jgi:biopolymer transport protein ExbD
VKIPTRERQRGLAFNITPLIDIVFQLVIFFLAATYIVRSDAHEKVTLPKAENAEDPPSISPRRWTITVTADGVWWLGNQKLAREVIEQRLQQTASDPDQAQQLEIRVRADARVPYRDIEPLMLACAKLGIRKLGFAVLQE